MTPLEQHREMLKLVELQQTLAEKAMASVIQRKRALLDKAQDYRRAAAGAVPSSELPSAGEMHAVAQTALAWRAEAKRCEAGAEALQPEISQCEAALAETVRRVTALKGILFRLQRQADLEEEEREDDALLDIMQLMNRT